MKKRYLLLLTFGCATITHNSFMMFRMISQLRTQTPKVSTLRIQKPKFLSTFDHQRILITKKSADKLQDIEKDYQKLYTSIESKTKAINTLYTKPSDFINEFLKDRAGIKYMSPTLVFFPDDIAFLDEEFNKISQEQNKEYAWHNTLDLMNTKLINGCNDLQKREIMHSAALVSLKQDQKLPRMFGLFGLGEYDDTISIDISDWEPPLARIEMVEDIKNHKRILLKE